MEKIISFTKMEELRKNKMRSYLPGIISGLLLFTSCSRKLANNNSNYVQKRKEEIAENEKNAKQTLEKKLRIDQRYADQLMQNANTSFYSKTEGNLVCLTGKEIIRFFEDSAQTKRGPLRIETLYIKPGQTKQYSMFINDSLYSRDVYYRNNYFLIDSIIKTDYKGLKSKIVFKYERDRFSLVSVDEKLTMKSNVFYLDDHYQCIKKETFNGSGDLVGSSVFSYDKHRRITEETDETRSIKYEYKNEQDDIYSAMRLYSKQNGELLTETLQHQDKNQWIQISKSNGVLRSKTILVTTTDGCIKTVYNYNGDNKIIEVYEYNYQY